MARLNFVLALLIIGSTTAWSGLAPADPLAPGLSIVAQAPAPTAAPTQPASPTPPTQPTAPTPPSASDPAQPAPPATAQAAETAIGNVATLQGSASVMRHDAQSPLKLTDAIYKGDVLQTSVDSTLGITFNDDTTFTLSANSRFSVDEFVYADRGTHNAAMFTVFLGKVAFIADKVAHTGNMQIATPTATLGIRGTTGVIEVPQGATPGTTGEVMIKLYPDANGRVGRIEVLGRDGVQLGVLSRGATGFSIQPGAPGGRFSAVALRISAQEAGRDRAFVRLNASARLIGHRNNLLRQNLQRQNLLQQNLQPSSQPKLQAVPRTLTPSTPKLQAVPGTLAPHILQPVPSLRVPAPKLNNIQIR